MSLDVYLKSATPTKKECPHCGSEYEEREEFYWANITHNLGNMAEAAGVYKHLWRPEEINITTAGQLIEPLKRAFLDMSARPEHYKQFNSSNGWGLYDHFVLWVERYLDACIENPEAEVYVSR